MLFIEDWSYLMTRYDLAKPKLIFPQGPHHAKPLNPSSLASTGNLIRCKPWVCLIAITHPLGNWGQHSLTSFINQMRTNGHDPTSDNKSYDAELAMGSLLFV